MPGKDKSLNVHGSDKQALNVEVGWAVYITAIPL